MTTPEDHVTLSNLETNNTPVAETLDQAALKLSAKPAENPSSTSEEDEMFYVTFESPVALFVRLWPQLVKHVPELNQRVLVVKQMMQRKAWRLLSTVPEDPELGPVKICKFYMDHVPLSQWINHGKWMPHVPGAEVPYGPLPKLVPVSTLVLLRIFSFAEHLEQQREQEQNTSNNPMVQAMLNNKQQAQARAVNPYKGLRFEDDAATWEFSMKEYEAKPQKVHLEMTAELLYQALLPDSPLFLRDSLLPDHFRSVFFDVRGPYSRQTHEGRVQALQQVSGKMPLHLYVFDRDLASQRLLCTSDASGMVQFFWKRYLRASKSQEATQGIHY